MNINKITSNFSRTTSTSLLRYDLWENLISRIVGLDGTCFESVRGYLLRIIFEICPTDLINSTVHRHRCSESAVCLKTDPDEKHDFEHILKQYPPPSSRTSASMVIAIGGEKKIYAYVNDNNTLKSMIILT